MLNERQEKIITLLKDNKNWMTGKQLSEFLNVSGRTIRSDIAYINLYQDDILIESNIRNGYHLNGEVSSNLNIHSQNVIPQTSFQRCFYIIHELLFKKNELSLIYVMDKVFISDSSMENDLKEIKKILVPYTTLKLIRCKNHISLEGNEENKRELYVNLLVKKIKGNFLNLDLLAGLFPNFDLLIVKELLERIFKKYNYCMREMELPVIMAYIGTAIERMLCYNYMQIYEINEIVSSSIEFSIAREFYENVSEKLHIEIKKDEITFLALILLGKTQTDDKDRVLLLNLDYTVNQLVSDILLDIYTEFDVDLREDEDLKKGLSTHIQLLLERKKNNIHISNLYLDELKYKYPFFFEMAIRVGKLIEDKLNVTIDENDISFIEQHLGGALERMNSKNKYRVIMINPNNQALSSLCIKKIESIFHERIKISQSINYFEKKEVLKINPDLILTTLPLEHNLNILTVQISIFVNSEDEIKIFKALNLLDSNRLRKKFITSFRTMMEPGFFYFDLDLDTPKEVLNFMSDQLYNAGLVEEEFKKSVLKREELSPTSFIYSFAIPHPLTAISKESKISVAILKKPMQWGEFQVKLVLLLAIQKDNQKIIRAFFDWLSNIISDSKKLSSLMKTKSYDEFINNIIE
ncbi:MAG: BglG family transcription antiterminator [Clostridiaceae bacterium]